MTTITVIAFPLPNPCPACGGVVTYSGRGRRPVHCSSRCKARADADSRPGRRRGFRQHETRPESPDWTLSHDDIRDEAAALTDGPEDPFELGYVPDGYCRRTARPRHQDPAAHWLAANHPEELADFGEDY